MDQNKILEINKDGWNKVAPLFTGVTALPVYGPLIETEDELKLFDGIKGSKVLEIGCGDGYSLEYMSNHGADELWGIDLSSVQIEMAVKHLSSKGINANLFASPMEKDINLPKSYFDIVFSIYALGWTVDLSRTLSLIFQYLKPGGSFIFSWEHPVFSCLSATENGVLLNKSYSEEGDFLTDNWRGKAPVVMHRRKISTYINELVKAGFAIERIIEGDLPERYKADDGFSEKWYSVYKAKLMPTTMIIKARKKI